MKPFNQFVQVLGSIIFLFIRYKHYKMFGTNATNEKGLPADPCRGDSGKESSQTQMSSVKYFFPGGPLVWKSPADRFVLIGTVQGMGFNCKYLTKKIEF